MTDLSKFDSQTRFLLANEEHALAAESDTPVSLILSGQGDFTEEQLDTLRALGINVHTVAGDIITADALITALNSVSDLTFIVSLQVSQPLFYEEEELSADFFSDAEE